MASSLLARLIARPLLRRILRPVLAFVVIVVAGIGGFMWLGDVGLVEATFWLLDPTSIAIHFEGDSLREDATKVFSVFVAAGLVLSTVWAGETVLEAALGGKLQDEIKRARQEREIMEMEEHIVVCGYGMFGRTVAARLDEAGRDIVVAEIDEGNADRARKDGFLAVTGDARREQILQEAEVEEAAALVAAVDDSNVNIQTIIAASQLAPQLDSVVRVGDEMYESLARRAGADHVVIPEVTTGESIAARLREEQVTVER